MNELTHSSASVTVQALPGKKIPAFKNPGDVVFEVKYPEDYKGPRLMPEGRVTVSRESAEQFSKMGIGSIVGDEPKGDVPEDEPAVAAEANEAKGKKNAKVK